MTRHMMKMIVMALVPLVLVACSANRENTVPVEDKSLSTNETDMSEQTVTMPDSSSIPPVNDFPSEMTQKRTEKKSAVIALLNESQSKSDSGQYESAIAALERAIRLDPKNAYLWHRLAVTRVRQQEWQQVINLAQKSLSLAADDKALQQQNWRIIATAKLALGDKRGAREASQKANQ